MTGPAGRTVLVVGAGPTGLAMAAQIHALGGAVRIIERRRERQLSRAFIVHPRTLEVLAPLGLADALIARGDRSTTAIVRARGRSAAVRLAGPAVKDTPYPFLLAIPQVAVDGVLEDHLRAHPLFAVCLERVAHGPRNHLLAASAPVKNLRQ